MKLNIDLDNKIVKVDNKVNIKELIDILKSMFPDTWKEFELDISVVNVTVKDWHTNIPLPYNPINPFSPYVITCGTASTAMDYLKSNIGLQHLTPINPHKTPVEKGV